MRRDKIINLKFYILHNLHKTLPVQWSWTEIELTDEFSIVSRTAASAKRQSFKSNMCSGIPRSNRCDFQARPTPLKRVETEMHMFANTGEELTKRWSKRRDMNQSSLHILFGVCIVTRATRFRVTVEYYFPDVIKSEPDIPTKLENEKRYCYRVRWL